MIMAKRNKITPEENEKRLNDVEINNCEQAIIDGIITSPPKRRTYKVGQRVRWGAHKETYVREVFADGKYYLIESIGIVRERNGAARNEFRVLRWYDIFPYDNNKHTDFTKKEKYFIRMLNSPISSIISMVHSNHAGVDMDVEYQREHVWKLSDKLSLIESIFNNIDIGKFVFIQRNEKSDGKYYEILDGKQRLTAITEFYEDRFKYKGYYFSELSFPDQHKFTDHGISYGYLVNPNNEAIFESFIKLNTCGKPMDIKHINHVKFLLKEFKEVKKPISEITK